jgi:hypothetical protein
MVNQDECKAYHRKRCSSAAFNGVPLYTNTQTCCYIQAVAETMLQEQITLAESNSSVQISKIQWHVGFSSMRHKPASYDMAPKPSAFARIRIVTLNQAGQLHCSCGFAERNGVPDRHVIHVAQP